jgi:signal transduction histidine kinase
MSENGEVRVRVRVMGNTVVVSIGDNGCGIPEEVRRQIFEPFFTTKRNSGNGLGLWVSSGIVKKHDGAMRMRSSTKAHRHGTLFQVRLPSHRKAPSKLSVA